MAHRKSISLKRKIELLKCIEEGQKQNDVASLFEIPKSTVNRIWKDRDNIKHMYENEQPDRKRNKPVEFDDIDKALLEWFTIQRNRNMPINGPILQAKALEFATAFKKDKFKCSEGWLDKWKKRHDIKFRVVSGDANKVNLDVTKNWIQEKWADIRQGYSAHDIYNADETGKFWRMLPNKSLHFSNETCSGGTQSKERVTILFCTNSDGTDKRKPLVIGKYQNPRPFKANKNRNSLPVEYFYNTKAWMTGQIFEQWLKRLDKEMQLKKRKIILTLDNVSSHPKDVHLKNIKLEFFPPNCTSVIQPLDQGIIKNFKVKYQFILIQKIIRRLDKQLDSKINILEAIFAIHAAWLKVTPLTIENCFKHAKVIAEAEPSDEELDIIEEIEDDGDDPVQEEFETMCNKIGVEGAGSLNDFATIDDKLLTEGDPTDAEIVAMFSSNIESSEEEEEIEEQELVQLPTSTSSEDALNAAETLRKWLFAQSEVDAKLLACVNELEQFVFDLKIRKLKQQKITNFFITV